MQDAVTREKLLDEDCDFDQMVCAAVRTIDPVGQEVTLRSIARTRLSGGRRSDRIRSSIRTAKHLLGKLEPLACRTPARELSLKLLLGHNLLVIRLTIWMVETPGVYG